MPTWGRNPKAPAQRDLLISVCRAPSRGHPLAQCLLRFPAEQEVKMQENRQVTELDAGRRSLVGDFRDWPLHEVLSWLSHGRRSALLRVDQAIGRAHVFVRDGQIFRVEAGTETGEAALLTLLTVEKGPFTLMLRTPPDARCNFTLSTGEFLLQAAASMDEWYRELEGAAS